MKALSESYEGKLMKTRNSFAAWSGGFVVLALVTACGGDSDSSTPAVAITVQPADRTVVAGTTATFEVVATDAIDFRWQRSTDDGTRFADVAGATGASYTTPATALADDGTRYRVVVGNSGGSLTSDTALLTVNAAPVLPAFTAQPGDASVFAPDPATFSVVATGTPTPTLQWQLSADGGGTWTDISGATGSSYTTPATSSGDSGARYRVVATNSVGPTTSAAATLTVTVPTLPSFTTQPADVTITAGGDAQFTVAVSGTPTPALQWQLSDDGGGTWTDLSGATGTECYVRDAEIGSDGRRFRAVATNMAGAVNSSAATLTVTPAAPLSITTSSPLPATIVNAPYSVTLAASGGTPPYTWSLADGYTLPAFFSLDASTGVLSGTPDVEAMYGWDIQVADAANPPNTDQRSFELFVARVCDQGLGFATVDNAPPTVRGQLCPETLYTEFVPDSLGFVWVVWRETYAYGGGANFAHVMVVFHPVSGEIKYLTFHLSDPLRNVNYNCSLTGDASQPACSGVSLDPTTGELTFLDTKVGMGTSPEFTLTLNGLLHYTP